MTTDLSKVTKDEIAAKLGEAEAEIDRWRQASQQRDADAKAIDACVKALDALVAAGKNARRDSYGLSRYESGPPEVERVLTYLRIRYGISDPAGERDALRSELNRAQGELEVLRNRFGRVYEAVQQ